MRFRALPLVLLFALSSGAQTPSSLKPSKAAGSVTSPPRVFLQDAKMLAEIKSAAPGDAHRQELLKTAISAADKAMWEGPFSVMQKGVAPPSGDKHDYMSQAPYFWPDPTKPNGLPYIRRDGEHNPEIKKITDHDSMDRMGEDARDLALAYYYTGNADYANRAALLLRTWFLDPSTRMNPNLEFGQGIPGTNTGRGIGLIETRFLMPALDAVGLLAGSNAWSVADQQGMKTWFEQFLHWMRTSEKGKAEDAAQNNHGSWYDLQVTDYALFIGDTKLAIETLDRVKTRRITVQIEPDGREPLELVRTNAFSYSIGNLDALMQLAWLGSQVGVDLWGYKTADGRCIRASLDFLLLYAVGARPWDYQQIAGFHGQALLGELRRAEAVYHDPEYEAAIEQLSGGKRNPAMPH
jgi:hypothetical protein